MLTVRFPNGMAVRYNSACFCVWGSTYHTLCTHEGGAWVATVPTDAIIEAVSPCRVYNALTEHEETEVARELRLLRRKLASMEIKKPKAKTRAR
jgi:hypothetical protein